jgi:medium-chain acyl-[acyl-carrier-protein] hydrolase
MGMIKLFCLPYAGGSAEVYRKWNRYLQKTIALEPLELSGRGKRAGEPFYESLGEAVADINQLIKQQFDGAPYAIFGHSMGGIIAYELYQKLQAEKEQLPIHMFFSGRRAPGLLKDNEVIHLLPDAELIAELKELGGTPPELLDNPDLLYHFLPIIRADFKIVETFDFSSQTSKLDCNITVFNGKDDDITFGELVEWRNFTTRECKIQIFPGGHFFINDYQKEIATIINQTLLGAVPSYR